MGLGHGPGLQWLSVTQPVVVVSSLEGQAHCDYTDQVDRCSGLGHMKKAPWTVLKATCLCVLVLFALLIDLQRYVPCTVEAPSATGHACWAILRHEGFGRVPGHKEPLAADE